MVDSVLYRFLTTAEKRMGMYFGSHSILDVGMHLNGWRAHRNFFPENDIFADRFFGTDDSRSSFNSFVATRYGEKRSIGWSDIIHEQCDIDDEEYPLFMALVREFAQSVPNS